MGMMIMDTASNQNEQEEAIINYNLKIDDIVIKKGRLPVNDYEVIVNISNQYNMKLNKKIKTKINNVELTVVGYYDSSNGENAYLVNENTAKYKLISQSQNLIIYAKDEEKVIENFDKDFNLYVENIYNKDKEQYLKEQKTSINSSIIFASIILIISLIEIYLIMRSSFLSRIKEVGILRAIGVKKRDIYKMFVGEILAITSTASMLGVALMTYILSALSKVPYISKMFVINVKVVGASIILIFAFNIVVGLLPLFRVLRKTPAQILSRHDLE